MPRNSRAKLTILAAATLAGLGCGAAVAASTGTLPSAADGGQATRATATSRTAATPAPATTAGSAATPAPAPAAAGSASDAKGPDATGPAKFGLCTAYSSGQGTTNGNRADSTAFQALATAAGGAGNIASFCADAAPGNASTPPGGGASSPQAGTQNGQGAEHANPASTEHGPESNPGSQSPRR
jgi:hypothetical protein